MRVDLLNKETAVTYACDHPMMSGREVEKESDYKMSRSAIDMARKRRLEKDDDYSQDNIIRFKKHHILQNDGKNILIFGDDKAIQRLVATNVIHADGTFTCVLPGYSQLYILHATVENNVSVPVLFCLLKKNEARYVKLLSLVEELANETGRTVFNNEVQLMCDFELALIKAVRNRYPLVNVKCCFFTSPRTSGRTP